MQSTNAVVALSPEEHTPQNASKNENSSEAAASLSMCAVEGADGATQSQEQPVVRLLKGSLPPFCVFGGHSLVVGLLLDRKKHFHAVVRSLWPQAEKKPNFSTYSLHATFDGADYGVLAVLASAKGRQKSWTASARKVIEEAKKGFVSVSVSLEEHTYLAEKASEPKGAPVWDVEKVKKLFEDAFRGRVIDKLEVLQQIR